MKRLCKKLYCWLRGLRYRGNAATEKANPKVWDKDGNAKFIDFGYAQLSRGALRLLDPCAAGARLSSLLSRVLPNARIEIYQVRIMGVE
jgi:hypothetical protein